MADVTIICLIYRSPEFAKGLYEKLLAVTPTLVSGESEFYFVANNANSRTLKYLKSTQIPFIEFRKKELSNAEHKDLGFAAPEYIGRVYAAYNFGIQHCNTSHVVLINSDMVFSDGWLEKLLIHRNKDTIVSCTLVERKHPKFNSTFPGAVEKNFGSSFRNLEWDDWLKYSNNFSANESTLTSGGAYMPALFRKEWFQKITFYPEGNLRLSASEYEKVHLYGDEFLFNEFAKAGISHVTTSTALCYHFKEGERATALSEKLRILYSVTFRITVGILRKFKNRTQ
jgi:GT2 family glycosyltransferase